MSWLSISLQLLLNYKNYKLQKFLQFFLGGGDVAQQPLVGQGLLILETSRSHSDTPHSVGLLWTSNQPDAENPTWQNTISQQTDIHAPGGFRMRYPSKRAAADPHPRPRGHWDPSGHIIYTEYCSLTALFISWKFYQQKAVRKDMVIKKLLKISYSFSSTNPGGRI